MKSSYQSQQSTGWGMVSPGSIWQAYIAIHLTNWVDNEIIQPIKLFHQSEKSTNQTPTLMKSFCQSDSTTNRESFHHLKHISQSINHFNSHRSQNFTLFFFSTRYVTAILFIWLLYSGRAEMIDVSSQLLRHPSPATMDETTIDNLVYTSMSSKPNIIIRTSGQKRLSDFLLWQVKNQRKA